MKKIKLKEPRESEIQKICLDYCKLKNVFAKRLNVGGMISHKDGKYIYNPYTARGMSDLLIVVEGLAIFAEIKRPTGKQSDNQRLFQAEAERAGARYVIIRSLDDLIEIIK